MRGRTTGPTTIVAFLVLAWSLAGCGGATFAEAEAVVEAHADSLVAIDGVSAVAAGKFENGKPCVRIYVEELTAELRALLPEKLDGIEVDVVVAGEFVPEKKTPGVH